MMWFIWPSAERALDLLKGAKTDSTTVPVDTNQREGKKRSFEDMTSGSDSHRFGEYIKTMGVSQFQQESTFEMEHAYDLSLICMPLPISLVGNHVYSHSLNDSLVLSQLP